jgi:electron transfer flavoprotein beta subunit
VKPLTVIVCIKDVPDPEGPASAFEIHGDSKKVVPAGIPPVINPFDENALEVGVRLKELHGGKIIALNVSGKAKAAVLKKALSVGADELILLEDQSFEDLSGRSVAAVLSRAIEKIGDYDLILTGRQAADWDSGQVGLLVGQMLQVPAISLGRSVSVENGKVTVEKLRPVGYEVVTAFTPALVTVSSEAGELRLPTIKAMQDARKKPTTVWRAEDIGIDTADLHKRNIRSLSSPPPRSRNCLFAGGSSPAERGENLVIRLREDRII